MQTPETAIVEQVRSMTNKDMAIAIIELQRQVAELVAAKTAKSATSDSREMTDDDARRVLTGDLADKKHKDAATALGLTYGQVYSCRLEFTFKHVHKEMKDANVKNRFVK